MKTAEGSLDELRQEIDEIDAAIHDLLMRRTEVVGAVCSAAEPGSLHLWPGREARILRRLIERHRGPFPKRVLVRVWREIISAQSGLQGQLKVAAFSPETGPDLRGPARDHFGSECQIASCETTMSVVRQVTERQAAVGVLPLPEGEEGDPWWRHLARDGESIPRIVARLPFAALGAARSSSADGMAVALKEHEATGLDRSFLVIEASEQLSRSKLTRLLNATGLTAINIRVWSDANGHRLHLVEVEGHLPTSDGAPGKLIAAGEPDLVQVWVIGGYAVPLSPEELADPDECA